jgi:hypothetical protein
VIILLIHSQDIVKLYKILLLYLSGPASAQVNTYSIAGFLCPGICGMTRLGGMGAGGHHPDFAVLPAPLQFRAEQSLRHGERQILAVQTINMERVGLQKNGIS